MNFFAHASLARLQDDRPGFVFGAMLPDFRSMAALRHESPENPVLSAGVLFHHRTDEAFHGSETFRSCLHRGVAFLEGGGMRRGVARGAAHVGIELVLDGALSGDGLARAAYRQALIAAGRADLSVPWCTLGDASSFSRLRTTLLETDLPLAYRDPLFVADRLGRILGRRPRLALSGTEAAVLERWMKDAHAPLTELAPRLVAETRQALGLGIGDR